MPDRLLLSYSRSQVGLSARNRSHLNPIEGLCASRIASVHLRSSDEAEPNLDSDRHPFLALSSACTSGESSSRPQGGLGGSYFLVTREPTPVFWMIFIDG